MYYIFGKSEWPHCIYLYHFWGNRYLFSPAPSKKGLSPWSRCYKFLLSASAMNLSKKTRLPDSWDPFLGVFTGSTSKKAQLPNTDLYIHIYKSTYLPPIYLSIYLLIFIYPSNYEYPPWELRLTEIHCIDPSAGIYIDQFTGKIFVVVK